MNLNYVLLVFVLFPCSVIAQTFSGTLTDEHRHPIAEAFIQHIRTAQHTHSDDRGVFILDNCKVGDTLQISTIGYQTEFHTIETLITPPAIVLHKKVIALEEVTISPGMNALHIISDIDIQTHPVNSSQDILRKVPGLFIGQHAGGGKAEQIFLRGFDIDHGTDINLTVDGLPVNMVSHAHGQGYADLHFVIPETVEKIDFGKGPYDQSKGNFATAGYVEFKAKEKLDKSTLKMEAGQFDTYRLLGMFDLVRSTKHDVYLATEFLSTNGYFESPQNFNRRNLFGKYTGWLTDQDKLGVTLSYFESQWDASGQIPQRTVDSGLISRFGAIDDTEGGATSRRDLLINYDKIIDGTSSVNSYAYFTGYDFELYSNFTFFLEDSINGDQIRQKEDRMIYGFNSEYNTSFSNGVLHGNWQAGISLRQDQSRDNELSHTANRSVTLEQIQFGDLDETNLGAYSGVVLDIGKWTLNPSVRLDYFNFQYKDKLLTAYHAQSQRKSIISPKFNILFNPSRAFQLYLKTGKGFHSNDTRVVVAQGGDEILPAAYGFDLGYIWKPSPDILINMAYWYLYLEQEFVYVGDAGIVEPSGKTKRQGIDLSARYQPLPWLFLNLDVNYTYARTVDEPEGNDYIPLAPDFTWVGGLSFMFASGWYGSLNIRGIANRPANEDNSIVAKGYTVMDLNAGFKWRSVSVGIQVQNLLNTEWNETQFATTSRLQYETNPVEEIHFTPGTPFFFKALVQYDF